MAENSAIEWTDHTFNPWEGCQKVGPGCDHCYAETRNARFGGGTAPNWGPGAPRRRTSHANWRKPLQWQADAAAFHAEHGRRQRVFCASLADVFDNAVNGAWRVDLASLILATPDLDWLLLTKRIGNAAGMLRDMFGRDVPANLWLGATIVNQDEADRDIPKLLATGGPRIRFLSMEPLLGPVDLTQVRDGYVDALRGIEGGGTSTLRMVNEVDWVIVGGESGPGARPMHPDWLIGLRDQCEAAGTPFLFKQWGEHLPVHVDKVTHSGIEFRRIGKKAAGRRLHGVQHDGVPA
ncbi:phage Gp37/Gp68 family protein [Sphingomonas sp. RHCKR47]|uniref:phage Gp37/Gp68 family protein n=1 Tax=Sphingomonas citricola TaxID=2862498 RepID=UPI001C687096|nr:phage Gp37/Gp68 family protein [Sphingomonas citricola]MBW6524461.1 phage Gp37/Gp68 family protein [Sphingomonas citricola]